MNEKVKKEIEESVAKLATLLRHAELLARYIEGLEFLDNHADEKLPETQVVNLSDAKNNFNMHFDKRRKEEDKNPFAVELGRMGGLKGGVARTKSLTKQQRIEIAKKAARKRWGKL